MKEGNTIKIIFVYLKPYALKTAAGIAFKASGTAVDLLLPVIMAYIVDNCIVPLDTSSIATLGFIMLILALSGVVCNVLANALASYVSQRFAKDLRGDMFRHIQDYSFREIDSQGIPSLINRLMNDSTNLQQMVLIMLRMVIRAPMLFFGGIFMAFMLDVKLTLVLLCTAPFLIFIIVFGMKHTVPLYSKLQRALDEATLVLRENLNGLKVVRAMSMIDYERHRYHAKAANVRQYEIRAGRWVSFLNPSMTLVMNLGLAAVVWFGGIRVNSGSMTTGEIMAFVNYFTMILNSMLVLTRIFMAYNKTVVSAERIKQIFNTKPSVKNGSFTSSSVTDETAIIFDNVSFTYTHDAKPAIKSLSFQAKRGHTLAIIGSTGSGKSTILSLIMRFYDADSGNIYVDGHNIKEYDLKHLRSKIAAVMQQSTMFSGTVAENIRWGKPEASDDEVWEALKIAQAKDFVTGMPKGADSMLSQNGSNLSGGQRQRLSIARALLRRPEILIFDDSQSALDYATDSKLRTAVAKYFPDTTVIIIAQRISSVMNADKIIVMDKGMMVGSGTHAELLANCPEYIEINRSQSGCI